jgi:hypothetical protein
MVLRAGFKKRTCLYFELIICDKYRGKNTSPQCVNVALQYTDSTLSDNQYHLSLSRQYSTNCSSTLLWVTVLEL